MDAFTRDASRSWPDGYTLVWTHTDDQGATLAQASGWSFDLDLRIWGRQWLFMQAFRPDGSLADEEVADFTVGGSITHSVPCEAGECPRLEFQVPPADIGYEFEGSMASLVEGLPGRVEIRDATDRLVAEGEGHRFEFTAPLRFRGRSGEPGTWSATWIPPPGWVGEVHSSVEPESFVWQDEAEQPPYPAVDLRKWPPTPPQALHIFGLPWQSVFQDGQQHDFPGSYQVRCAVTGTSADGHLDAWMVGPTGTRVDLEIPTTDPCFTSLDVPPEASVPGWWTLEAKLGNEMAAARQFEHIAKATTAKDCGAPVASCEVGAMEVFEGTRLTGTVLVYGGASTIRVHDSTGVLVASHAGASTEAWTFDIPATAGALGTWKVHVEHAGTQVTTYSTLMVRGLEPSS